jgi:hypothetical protein
MLFMVSAPGSVGFAVTFGAGLRGFGFVVIGSILRLSLVQQFFQARQLAPASMTGLGSPLSCLWESSSSGIG